MSSAGQPGRTFGVYRLEQLVERVPIVGPHRGRIGVECVGGVPGCEYRLVSLRRLR